MLMLSTIMLIPLIQYETYWTDTIAYDTAINFLYERYKYNNQLVSSDDFQLVLKDFLSFDQSFERTTIVSIRIMDTIVHNVKGEWRTEELKIYESTDFEGVAEM